VKSFHGEDITWARQDYIIKKPCTILEGREVKFHFRVPCKWLKVKEEWIRLIMINGGEIITEMMISGNRRYWCYKRLPQRREEIIELIKKRNNRLAPSFISSSSQLPVSIKIQNIVKSLPGDWRKSDNSYAKVRPCCKGSRLPCRCQVLTKKFRVVVFPSFMSQSQIGKKRARPMPCLCRILFFFLHA